MLTVSISNHINCFLANFKDSLVRNSVGFILFTTQSLSKNFCLVVKKFTLIFVLGNISLGFFKIINKIAVLFDQSVNVFTTSTLVTLFLFAIIIRLFSLIFIRTRGRGTIFFLTVIFTSFFSILTRTLLDLFT